MKVLKFGGTSVGKPENMKKVSQIVLDNQPKIVVLSALSGVTNLLVKLSEACYQKDNHKIREALKEIQERHLTFIETLLTEKIIKEKVKAFLHNEFVALQMLSETENFVAQTEKEILSKGEIISTHIFQFYLEELNQKAVLLSSLDFMRIDEGLEPDLTFLEEKLPPILSKYPENKIFIAQGYICLNAQDEIDNLQRGGSDYTASLIGAAIRAEEIQIWTDIDGMHNNDPRFVEGTFPIAELSFEEAAELAYFGAKILHPASIHPARKYSIPVRIKNTMQPEAKGTLIQAENDAQNGEIKSIAAKDGITAIKIKSSRMLLAYGFLKKVFEVFEQYQTSIDMITTSEVAVSLTIDNDSNLQKIEKELKNYGQVEIDPQQSIICIVGDFVSEQKGLASQIFKALESVPVRMISFGGSLHNISVLVPTDFKKEALNALNLGLFADELSV